MKLVSTTQQYEFTDASGYSFTVTATHDPEWGWAASVTMESSGFKTPEAAIAAVARSAAEFVRQVKET